MKSAFSSILAIWLFFLNAPLAAQDTVGPQKRITIMVIDSDAYILLKALSRFSPSPRVIIDFFSISDLKDKHEEVRRTLLDSKVIIVDVMARELEKFILKNIPTKRRIIYALRGSSDDDRLKKAGFLFDQKVRNYFDNLSLENIQNLVKLIIHRHFDPSVSYEKVRKSPKIGIYHPDAPDLFTEIDSYLNWLREKKGFNSKRPWLGITFFSSSLLPGQRGALDYLIRTFEREGFNVIPCFGKDIEVLKRFFMKKDGKARIDLLIAFTLKFYSSINERLKKALIDLDIPVINAVTLYKPTLSEWRKSPIGVSPMEVSWSMATPEISGLIEPTVLTGRRCVVDRATGRQYFVYEVIEENLQLLLARLKALYRLKQTPNRQKRVAIMFYNHHPGKQNVGASYLNVFESLKNILSTLGAEGYVIGPIPDEDRIRAMILSQARNIGSWAPGELNKMISKGNIITVPIAQYKKWFSRLPKSFQRKVLEQWGKPEDSLIMKYKDSFIIPAVRCGNILLLPEPSRGWGDDPIKLYHSPTLYPHHQYLAVYLWLVQVFDAHAIVHLGTHATYEWTPGKQAGLSPSCSPEVLINHLPNIYPYIVDDIGEAIQAKRRGRGVMVSHLTPMLRRSGLYREYLALADLINNVRLLRAKGGVTAEKKITTIQEIARKTGILKDIGIDGEERLSFEQMERLLSYLEEIRADIMPAGLHAFGRTPPMDAALATATLIAKENGLDQKEIESIVQMIRASGKKELLSLVRGLSGKYVEPGEGNDPVRNISSLPTGRNLYGFNPDRIPSKEAWLVGKKAAQQLIKNYMEKHGRYPEKVAIVLWATETQRNEGVNECTILWLIGVRPVWTPSGRVRDLEVIPGRELERPRIDVIINPSGLYRDLFPDRLKFLDKAIQLAALQRDIDNLIAKHSQKLKSELIAKGLEKREAEKLSMVRIFSEKPGSYGTGVSEMTSVSGLWETDQEVADVFENRVGFAYGQGMWGKSAKSLLKAHLKGVDAVVHSRSSNLYATMDNDDVFQYLGGLALAVSKEAGRSPETLITVQTKKNKAEVEDVAKTIGRELRARYLNPRWIKAMQKEGYAGAREMSNFVDYMWGWQVTTPEKIDASKWHETFEVYVEDKYGLDIKDFFLKNNPWAFQSITGRMLEAIRKGYWTPKKEVVQKIAAEYVWSVVTKGVACCDHTCNNPFLNQMVVSIISVPGVLSPEIAEKFKMILEKTTLKGINEQADQFRKLQAKLKKNTSATENIPSKSDSSRQNDKNSDSYAVVKQEKIREVEGYKMEKIEEDKDKKFSSSGVEWLSFVAIFLVLILFLTGIFSKKQGRRQNKI
ncbi:CobN component of cobalt chelatase involved in B12 biosynthesis [Dissulfuribacter thermophilus]|uniref:CobN component of cobalt chelatase involved in B12 biosynthesis n=1 Tax=Dissulfuribacter thermophilus TaxID=1156395 RepID=A0A1B9F694_9BACT|nr:cobaltochelatase subunit CobN [Dissulfuribacter thermophilus]OCC15335.1 CobN component of cobalt chelatase involved in B12 biosynthesis [Dissulfuribacter thermophilus]